MSWKDVVRITEYSFNSRLLDQLYLYNLMLAGKFSLWKKSGQKCTLIKSQILECSSIGQLYLNIWIVPMSPSSLTYKVYNIWQYFPVANSTGTQIFFSIVWRLHSSIWDLKYTFLKSSDKFEGFYQSIDFDWQGPHVVSFVINATLIHVFQEAMRIRAGDDSHYLHKVLLEVQRLLPPFLGGRRLTRKVGGFLTKYINYTGLL